MAFKKTRGNFGDRGVTRSRDRPSGDRSFGKKPFGASRGGAKPGSFQLYDVTCSRCGKRTQVPFKPTGEKPVLCRECFKGGDSSSRDRPRARSTEPTSDLREINEKLDKIMRHFEIE